MKLKIYYKGTNIWNMMIFIVLSLVFVAIQKTLIDGGTIFSSRYLVSFVEDNIAFVLLASTTMIFVFLLRGIARYLFIAMTLITTVLTAQELYREFNKIILTALFVYLLISYLYLLIFSNEVKKPYYIPMYSTKNLFEPMLQKIPVELGSKDGVKLTGILTNWSEQSCFIKLDKELEHKLDAKDFLMRIDFEGIFEEEARLVSEAKDGSGIGLMINKNEDNQLGWNSFIEVISDRGFKVEYLR